MFDTDDGGVGGGPFPNLTIFQNTASIYTFMSFLGILDPAALYNLTSDSYNVRVLCATLNALSAILSSNVDDDVRCAKVRSELRDLFVPAFGRLVGLVGGIVSAMDMDDGRLLQQSLPSTEYVPCWICSKICCDWAPT